jgi:hypothetical protein
MSNSMGFGGVGAQAGMGRYKGGLLGQQAFTKGLPARALLGECGAGSSALGD